MHGRCTREVRRGWQVGTGGALLHGLGVAHVGLYLGDVLDLVRVRLRARVRVRVRVGARVGVRVSLTPSVSTPYRGDIGEIQGRYRGDTGEI